MHVASGDIHYVDAASTNATAPYTNWATAATVIQDAIDEAQEGDTVLVTNGVYATGGGDQGWSVSNRIAATTAITVQSVGGPGVTYIEGGGAQDVDPVRCAYLTGGATLSGFTLTNGHSRSVGYVWESASGGAYCSGSALVSNCVISGNSGQHGGGTYQGTIWNCLLSGNTAGHGGGGTYESSVFNSRIAGNSTAGTGGGMNGGSARNCMILGNRADYCGGAIGTIESCTICGNSADIRAGGVGFSSVGNSIVYYNLSGDEYDNWCEGQWSSCCTIPDPGGIGNVTSPPGVLSPANPFLVALSPCIDKGQTQSWMEASVDVDGETRVWGDHVDIGCDEFHPEGMTGLLSVAVLAEYTNAVVGTELYFDTQIGGRAEGYRWDFGDGTFCSNVCAVKHAYSAAGDYQVELAAWNAETSAVAAVTVCVVAEYAAYVSPYGSHVSPYTNWGIAATNLQVGVDSVTFLGGSVFVSNGVYDAGSRVVRGDLSNRVAVTRQMSVIGVSGPEQTFINGTGPNGSNAVRCVYLGEFARLTGFTLTNGATLDTDDERYDGNGGGAWCELTALVSNCVISGNSADCYGGGVYRGTLTDCILSGNSAEWGGGGAAACSLLGCALIDNTTPNMGGGGYEVYAEDCDILSNIASYAGGVCRSTTERCYIAQNAADSVGGGSAEGTSWNSLIVSNAARWGGGVATGYVFSCTVVGNSAEQGGGTWGCSTWNSIVYHNTATVEGNNYISHGNRRYTCTSPWSPGEGNITNEPGFVSAQDGDFRLAPSSGCIDAGMNRDWMQEGKDLEGNPRIINGTVDMGAYETPFAVDVRVWLQGPYDPGAHSMSAALDGTAIPSNAPYAADPCSVSVIPTQTTDWVLLELREGTNGPVVSACSGFVLADGQVASETSGTGVMVNVSSGSSCYLAVKHRNHTAAMSAEPIVFTNILMAYDFTTGPDRYYGGTNGCIELEPGVWGMIAGDADGDGKITRVDRAIASNQVGRSGYWCGDVDLSGDVDE
ncbi:MAG: PKD domain-containing protein [Kiritimatiellae bacterium]|nr:PKD domain-containing protein [Kiritimatiellia bacterium]